MKKRNLFIGIALVAVILVALYMSNYTKSIFEGVQPAGSDCPSGTFKTFTYNGAKYCCPSEDMYKALQTVEDILNGKKKINGTGQGDFDEFNIDLSGNLCYNTVGSVQGISSFKYQITPVPIFSQATSISLSYNETIQTIYAFAKAVASNTDYTWIKEGLNALKPFLHAYSAFISKLNSKINYIINNDNTNNDCKQLLLIILSKNLFTFTEEGTTLAQTGPKMPGFKNTQLALYNVDFEQSINYLHNCFHIIYNRGSTQTSALQDFFLCIYNENPAISTSVLQINFNSLNLNFKLLKQFSSQIQIANSTDSSIPIFIELIATYVNANHDNGGGNVQPQPNPVKLFSAYGNFYSMMKSPVSDQANSSFPKLLTYLSNRNDPNASPPLWFKAQTISSANAPVIN